MKGKVLMPIAIVVLISLIILVSAVQMDKDILGYGTIGANYIQNEVYVTGGWNLIQGLANPDWITGGEVSSDKVKAIFGLNPLTKEYIRFYPENQELKNLNISLDYLLGNTVFWIYIEDDSNNELKLKYYTMEFWPLDKKKLFSDWNFIGITSEMSDKTLNQIKGECILEKVYLWDFLGQRWSDEFSPEQSLNNLDKPIDDDWEGYGFVIKVSEDCILGTIIGEGVSPPKLP